MFVLLTVYRRQTHVLGLAALWLAGIVFAISLLRMVGHFAGVYGMEWVGRKVVADLRQELFGAYVGLPATFYDRFSSGQLISKLAYNSEQVANAATTSVVSAFRDVLLVIFLLGVMLITNAKLTLVMLLLVPMIGLLVTVISRRFRKISRRIQDMMGNVSHVTEEAVAGQQVVKVFQGQEAEKKRFETVNDKTRRLHMRLVSARLTSSSLVQVAAGLALVLLMVIATRPSMLEHISAGTFTAIFTAMIATIPPLKRLTTVQSQLQKGIAAADSIFQVLDTEPERDSGSYTVLVSNLCGDAVSMAAILNVRTPRTITSQPVGRIIREVWPFIIALIAVPILIQVYFNSGLAYLLNRRLRVAHCVAGPSALIGASNFFELAVAAAISARPALPCCAMGRPSNVVATAVDAPGIPKRTELIAPPYIAP